MYPKGHERVRGYVMDGLGHQGDTQFVSGRYGD